MNIYKKYGNIKDMFYLSVISDALFGFIISFFISLIVLVYFISFPYSVIFSLLFGALFFLVSFRISKTKKQKRLNAEKEKRDITDSLNMLCLKEYNSLLDIFYKALKVKGEHVELCSKYIADIKNKKKIFPLFNFEGLKKSDVVKAFNQLEKNETAIIYTSETDKEIKDFVSRFKGKIVVVDFLDTYNLLKETDSLFSLDYVWHKDKNKTSFFADFFNKKRAKKFLGFGSLMLAFSFFMPFKLYYLVCGSVLMVFACISKFFGKTNEENLK